MTTGGLLVLIGLILMVLGSLPIPSKVSLWNLGVAFVFAGWSFGSGAIVLR
jgi:hypothetical protein